MSRELADSSILIVGTYRDVELSRQHPLSQALGELSRTNGFQRVFLRGLDHEDVRRFIEISTGATPSLDVVNTVHTHTEGNPFFMTEVVRLLVQEGGLVKEGADALDGESAIRIPEGVREVVGRRLNRLSEQCNQVLTVASAIGREFNIITLNRLVDGLSEDQILDALEEAARAHVIDEQREDASYYQFTHALVQETLVEEISLSNRVRLHARIAIVLEELYSATVDEHAAELAHHYSQAEAALGVLGTEKLAHYSLVAGEQALHTYAYEDALAHFQRAQTAKKDKFEDAESASMYFGLGRAQIALDIRDEALGSLRRAFDFYAHAKDVTRAVEVASVPLPAWATAQIPDILANALDLVEPEIARCRANFVDVWLLS